MYSRPESLYYVAAVREYESRSGHGNEGLVGSSPDSADQLLFRQIVGTIREDSRTSTHGHLFFGGNRIAPPYVFKSLNGRLVVNGYALPVLPPPTRPPVRTGELEARSAFEVALLASRDSLLSAGNDWESAKEALRSQAAANPLVKAVEDGDDPPMIRIVWPSGYQFLGITKHGSLHWGGGRNNCFEENEQMVSSRLDHLHGLLEGGGILFLIGGGAEHTVDRAHVGSALRGIQRLGNGLPLSEKERGILPLDVQEQLVSPIDLELVR